MPTKIKLNNGVWQFDDNARLGPPGGFGEVFRGEGDSGPVAIKRLRLSASAAAHREMNIGKALSSRALINVLPVLDFGQDADGDRYYLVMPICDHSLQDLLDKVGSLSWNEAKTVALDIISGLSEVGDIVHRDLKPGNVLWHEGRWKVADFGIAKFVEDSTSMETLRRFLSPPYAAPEQWNGEAPTRAADVYALGCVIHAMVNGSPPFNGDVDALRQSHLDDQPPDLKDVPSRLEGLVHTMLRKSAASRPSIERCGAVIRLVENSPTLRRNEALAAAANAISREASEAEAKARFEERSAQKRLSMASEANTNLRAMIQRILDEIEASSDMVKREDMAVALGPARLMFDAPERISLGHRDASGLSQTGWDIAAFSTAKVHTSLFAPPHYAAGYSFGASLVFASIPKDKDFRWREISFWSSGSGVDVTPFSLSPLNTDFQLAVSNVGSSVNIAHGPLAIDAEDEDSFTERWIGLFTKAASRELHHPGQMPIPSYFFK